MDCVKNLTACQGCTRKHARCSWKDVTEAEIESLRSGSDGLALRSAGEEAGYAEIDGAGASVPTANGVFTAEGVSGVSAAVGVEGARALAPDAASAASLAAAAQAVTALPETAVPQRFEYKMEVGGNAGAREGTDTPGSSVAKSETEVERGAWNGS